jgi:glycine cleavage system aminomethyltransferase T
MSPETRASTATTLEKAADLLAERGRWDGVNELPKPGAISVHEAINEAAGNTDRSHIDDSDVRAWGARAVLRSHLGAGWDGLSEWERSASDERVLATLRECAASVRREDGAA